MLSRIWRLLHLLLLSGVAFGETAMAAGGSGTAEEAPDRAVSTALVAESQGDLETRRSVARELSRSTSSQGKWLLGYLRDGKGSWRSIDESVEQNRQNAKLDSYERKRAMASDSVEDHTALAKWCQTAGLAEQRRAHLIHLLRLDPDNLYAHQALGHVRAGWDWIAPEQMARFKERELAIRRSMSKYGNWMQAVIRDLESKVPATVDRAEARLSALEDANAIPALDAAFSTASTRSLEAGLTWLANHRDPSASSSLLRFALFHPNEAVRQLAMSQLARRDHYEFVPQLIELVKSPVDAIVQPVFDRNGTLLGLRQAFSQVGLEQDKFVVMETAIKGVRSGPGNQGLEREVAGVRMSVDARINPQAVAAIERTQEEASQRQRAISERNDQIKQLNARASELVTRLAGREVSADPVELWSWWYAHNERERANVRTARYVRLYDENSYQIESRPSFATGGECFVKGTLVTTHRGRKAIDRIVIGDLVLSKNIQSGELAWKPVLETTRRSPSPVYSIEIGGDKLESTSAHLFWVSGKGWRKASELKVGEVLHGATEPMAIDGIEKKGEAETFNLVVADFANYFVGNHAILSHDFTARSHVRETVPGYLPQ